MVHKIKNGILNCKSQILNQKSISPGSVLLNKRQGVGGLWATICNLLYMVSFGLFSQRKQAECYLKIRESLNDIEISVANWPPKNTL
ncbi:hypothetical protein CEXT_756171 [Caerostris extrusa]|uniref:Uncharacterized protein n=1 Tax=Caerostris extrusa TaxID=172846 RepID=A0AAV4NJB5_CAEEX|nr:hypothetical protein CEXT_756171 [Caerostris extrusa]